MRGLSSLVACGFLVGTARADGTLLDDDTWRYRSHGDLAIDAGLVAGFPAALPTGLSTGIGAGVTKGGALAWGARASWTSAVESSAAWTVAHDDVRLRAFGALRHVAGRGAFGLRFGVGGTVVYESRVRNQGMRAGLTGDALATSALALLPAADVEATVALHIAGPWLFVASGGPSVTIDRAPSSSVPGDAGHVVHGGWTSQIGVAWQP